MALELLTYTPGINKYMNYCVCVHIVLFKYPVRTVSQSYFPFFLVPFSVVMWFICSTIKFLCHSLYSFLISSHTLIDFLKFYIQ